MKTTKQKTDYTLTAKNIDAISEQITQHLSALHTEHAQAVRIRFSLEEALLRWQDFFGCDTAVTLDMTNRFGNPQISLLIKGKQYNPLVHSESDTGEWMQTLFNGTGQTPVYIYRQGVNAIQIKLQKKHSNPALTLLIALAGGVIFGLAGILWLPQELRETVLRTVLGPLQNAFFRILNLAAGPVIFLSMLTAICGVGSLSVMSSSGKRLIFRFITICLLVAAIATCVAVPLFHISPQFAMPDMENVESGLDLLLQIVPTDLLSPLIECNSVQLIVLALLLGYVLLKLGKGSESLTQLAQQANAVALTVAGWIGNLALYFISALLILTIWNSSSQILLGLWKPLLLFLLTSVFSCFGSVLHVSITKKTRVRILLRKMLPSFRMAFRTSSVDASFRENLHCCTSKLGIHTSLTDYGLPLGLVTYMPSTTISMLVFVLYVAKVYHVQVTLVWIVTAILLTTALVMASPPVTGVGLLAYAALFAQLKVPSEALIAAMVADILFGFLASAVNQAMLQMELTLEADRLHMLDTTTLQSETEAS